jgi:hypothetical protein
MFETNIRTVEFNRTDPKLKQNLADVLEMLHSTFRYMTETEAPIVGHYRLQSNPTNEETYLGVRTSQSGITAMAQRFGAQLTEISALDMPQETVPELLWQDYTRKPTPFLQSSFYVPEGFRLDLCALVDAKPQE